jgi:hypothetical protein
LLYTVTTESTYYGIVDYIKAEYVMGDYSLYKALEREFVADSERCEHELAVFRLKKKKSVLLVNFGGGGVVFQEYVCKILKKKVQMSDTSMSNSRP